MLRRFRRQYCRRHVCKFVTITSLFLITSFIISTDLALSEFTRSNDDNPRQYCILLLKSPLDDKLIHATNVTWGKNCYKTGIVRHTRSESLENDYHGSKSLPYHINTWERILIAVRQLIHLYEFILKKDTLVVVPLGTFVFQEKLALLFRTSANSSKLPLIIIYEQQEESAYIFNGRALDLVRHTELMDSCLKMSYPSARETYLWRCIKHKLIDQHAYSNCNHGDNNSENCFIRHYRSQLTLSHIKNGFCLNNNLSMCQSLPLAYPATFSDMITLEFFKYRLKSRSSHDVLEL